MRRLTTGAATKVARSLVTAGVLCGAALLPSLTQASETCAAPDAAGTRRCSAAMDEARVRQIAATQEMSQWCWAASISMIFAYHGLRLPQQSIVRDVHGSIADVNAPSGEAMTAALRRHWRDSGDREFAVSSVTGDIAANRYEIANAGIVDELRAGRPLLIGSRGHAMVMIGASYERRADGQVVIHGASVIDPLPGKGVRRLGRSEMVLSYISSVHVAGVPAASHPDTREAAVAPGALPPPAAPDAQGAQGAGYAGPADPAALAAH